MDLANGLGAAAIPQVIHDRVLEVPELMKTCHPVASFARPTW
jgi:hypothetical protein